MQGDFQWRVKGRNQLDLAIWVVLVKVEDTCDTTPEVTLFA
jgi:hypothetical protein